MLPPGPFFTPLLDLSRLRSAQRDYVARLATLHPCLVIGARTVSDRRRDPGLGSLKV